MNERLFLVQNLRRRLLGPRDGALEVLPVSHNPRDEYVTGVLTPWTDPESEPAEVAPERDIDSEVDSLDGESGVDDEDEDTWLTTGPGFSPSLDPRALPPSIGLTFMVQGDLPQLSICVTGARYELVGESWHRRPFGHVTGFAGLGPGLDRRVPVQSAAVEVRLRTTAIQGGILRVSIFLTNVAEPPQPGRQAPTDRLLFQPQIRVALGSGTRLVSLTDLDTGSGQVSEDASMRLLYGGSPVCARGHLCGAVWRDIDPEQPEAHEPWVWTDREACDALERERFSCADVRTEFLPVQAVSAPSMHWREEYGPAPVREAEELAETWEPDDVARALKPLVDGYARWLEERQEEAASIPTSLQSTAQEHVARCNRSLERMRAGLVLLQTDPQARLAFCFANKAIAEQSRWQGRALCWHPFQLGFILQCLAGLTDPESPDRLLCDLLWFPTGGGKTEAYLGLIAYVMALRRLRRPGLDGTAVISRYTLRLLTIQQFRRALRLVTACEVLRVANPQGPRGWRPRACPDRTDWLWGTGRFSAGLWVGGNVTPNKLQSAGFPPRPGALELLQSSRHGDGEPAQVLHCPACSGLLALPDAGREPAVTAGTSVTLHLVLESEELASPLPTPEQVSTPRVQVQTLQVRPGAPPGYHTVTVTFVAGQDGVLARHLDEEWWEQTKARLGTWIALSCARPSRPGYFLRKAPGLNRDWNFDIFCPNPECALVGTAWREQVPVSLGSSAAGKADEWQLVHPAFRAGDGTVADRVPVPALTVDDQIYAWPPSLVVATVDKFARLAYEPRAATLFGSVEHYHARDGYYRAGSPREPASRGGSHPTHHPKLTRDCAPLRPPDLILQDELHLIDGPLGSMVGIYETVVEHLCQQAGAQPKYIASTATVREADDQVRALFLRELGQFPASGLDASDSFFALVPPGNPRQEEGSGRLYLGFLAPARGSLTPLVRLWSILLQAGEQLKRAGRSPRQLDPYWTPVGYFNAVRELAGVTGLLRQDIPQWMEHLDPGARRELNEAVELSSRMDSLRLPSSLARLERQVPEAEDAVLATSMFGTGVDVTRLSLMIVHGQPKTTSAYIQATGRVGRATPGLIVTAFRASRPRDLDHYEFFTGYHRQLYRGVEPVTVYPFSPRARERALGPLCVALLRQAGSVSGGWRLDCQRMAGHRGDPEVVALTTLLEDRAQGQPPNRRPGPGTVGDEAGSALDAWRQLVRTAPGVVYAEYALTQNPQVPVVLGDAQHVQNRLPVAYPNAPQSLRDVEPTTGFKT
ncbi:MAG: DISARM system helicase DrmA [Candidatus Eremiobacterota bacterium]